MKLFDHRHPLYNSWPVKSPQTEGAADLAPGFLMRPSSQILASSNRQNVRICRAFWSSADVQRTGFFATAYYASPCALWTQACFSKSSCTTRLKVSAATVLSMRGAVIPHVQWEQHQPLKSSPSIQVRCLFIYL